MPWTYDTRSHRYRDSDSGRYLNQNQVRNLVNQSIDAAATNLSGITALAGNGQISPADFNARMRDEIKYSTIRQYALGRGGLAQMTQEDWGSIGGMLADQYRYLGPFSAEIGDLSEAQIAARAAMYIRSSREAYERAKVRARGMAVNDLPVYPTQDTICLTNCRCSWSIEEIRDNGALIGFDCYWRLGDTDRHCTACTGYAAAYNPYQIRFWL